LDAVYNAHPSDEQTWLEWKSTLDLRSKEQMATIVCRSFIGSCGLSWGYAAWWYSLITPAMTGLRRMVRRSVRSAASRVGSV
jgi:hypothetical protein